MEDSHLKILAAENKNTTAGSVNECELQQLTNAHQATYAHPAGPFCINKM